MKKYPTCQASKYEKVIGGFNKQRVIWVKNENHPPGWLVGKVGMKYWSKEKNIIMGIRN